MPWRVAASWKVRFSRTLMRSSTLSVRAVDFGFAIRFFAIRERYGICTGLSSDGHLFRASNLGCYIARIQPSFVTIKCHQKFVSVSRIWQTEISWNVDHDHGCCIAAVHVKIRTTTRMARSESPAWFNDISNCNVPSLNLLGLSMNSEYDTLVLPAPCFE